MPKFAGMEVWIEMEGTRLEEYKVEEEGDRIECWVPCEAGKVCHQLDVHHRNVHLTFHALA